MKERPILFSGPMVRAILAGQKTQTRRIYKPREPEPYEVMDFDPVSGAEPWPMWTDPNRGPEYHPIACPYGVPGDRLWVRETFAYVSPHEGSAPLSECRIEYRADLAPGNTDGPGQWPADCKSDDAAPKWRPSIFMPRKVSRIDLKVTDVRVERLKAITAEDARAEGVDHMRASLALFQSLAPVDDFRWLWESINGPRAWELNLWVWVVTFRRAPAYPLVNAPTEDRTEVVTETTKGSP